MDFNVEIPEINFGEEIDYSNKNKEVDTKEFSDNMILKFEVKEEEFKFIMEELSKIDANKEIALLKTLGYES